MSIIYPEPVWTQCQPVKEACSSLVTTGITPYIIKGIVLQLLRFQFGDCDNIRDPALKGFTWSGDGSSLPQCDIEGGADGTGGCATGPIIEADPLDPDSVDRFPEPVGEGGDLFIGGSGDLDLSQVGQRPGLFVRLGTTTNERITALQGSATANAVNPKTGNFEGSKHLQKLQGYVEIYCVSVSETTAELLGSEVYYRMMEYSPVIETDFRISRFSCTRQGTAAKLPSGEQTTAWAVIVRIEWAHIHTWRLRAEAPLLKRIHLQELVNKQELGD